MSRHIKIFFSAVIVMGSSAAVYRWFKAVKVPAVSAAAGPAATPAPPAVPEEVERVRNGKLPENGNVTVGQAFEKTFQSPEWKTEVNLQGDKVVVFHGTASYAAMKEAGFYIGTWNGVSQGIEAAKKVADYAERCKEETGQTDEAKIAPCMTRWYQAIRIPVTFEFTQAAGKGVEMTQADAVFQTFDRDHRLRKDRAATLAFVYR